MNTKKEKVKVNTYKDMSKIFRLYSDLNGWGIVNRFNKNVVYSKGICDNVSGITRYDGMSYNIRSLGYCLINDCDYQRSGSLILPSASEDGTRRWKFALDDIVVTTIGGIPWKDLPQVGAEAAQLDLPNLYNEALTEVRRATPEAEAVFPTSSLDCYFTCGYDNLGEVYFDLVCKNTKDRRSLRELLPDLTVELFKVETPVGELGED